MAIPERVPGLQACVLVDGNALPEYDHEEIEPTKPGPIGEHQAVRTVSKYIEAVSGKEFGIRISLNTPFKLNCPTLTVRIQIDGKWVGGTYIRKASHPASYRGANVISRVDKDVAGARAAAPDHPRMHFLKPFKFSAINTSKSFVCS